MRNKGYVFIGGVIVLVGVILLIGNVFSVSLGRFCWPVGLILLGVWLLVRPRLVRADVPIRQKLLGDIRRGGVWQVTDEEFWIGVGDVDLDMTNAEVPTGEIRLRFYGFVGDVDVLVPEGVGVSVSSTAFVTDARVLGQRQEGLLSPIRVVSDDYETAERKVRLELIFFVMELKVRQV